MQDIVNTCDLFNAVVGRLKKGGMYPALLDYGKPSRWSGQEIDTPEFDLVSELNYGTNEGIYLNLFVSFLGPDAECRFQHSLGVFKTLDESDNAMRTMGILLSDFTLEVRKYVRENYDLFDRRGYYVRGYREDGTRLNYALCADTLGTARSRMSEFTWRPDVYRISIFDKREQREVCTVARGEGGDFVERDTNESFPYAVA